MAAASPALSNNSSDTAGGGPPGIASSSAVSSSSFITPAKTLRGLNKPKCIQCGNVARSRCPYKSCKSCCSRAQNPCHIHVLKANATFSEKVPTSSTPVFEQPATEVSPAQNSLRAAAVRQLSSTFSQFNNLQIPLRSRKPLTRKEAAAINEWRFSKLKEFKERNIEVENEAFDRYMLNISLLEEVVSAKSIHDDASEEDDPEKIIAGQKLKLRSNPVRSENVRKRIQEIVDVGMKKLQKRESNDGANEPNELDKTPEKAGSLWAERASPFNDLIDKLNKARNEEDLKSCLEMKAQLYTHHSRSIGARVNEGGLSQEQTAKDNPGPTPSPTPTPTPMKELDFCSQKLFRCVEIDAENLKKIDAHFSSLEKIEDL